MFSRVSSRALPIRRRPLLPGLQLPGLAVPFGLHSVTVVAAVVVVAGRGFAPCGDRLDVIALVAEPVAAVHALDPVELRWSAQLESPAHLGRSVAAEGLELPEILAVVEDAGQEGVFGELFGNLRRDRPETWDLADLAGAHLAPAAL